MAGAWDLGGIRIRLVPAGGLKLDGGAMFGIIPKPLWTRSTPADDKNRIALACNSLVVDWEGSEAGRRAVIETGHGEKYNEKEQKIYEIDPQRWLLAGLTAAGVGVESVTDVVLTHLHFDHAGGLTRRDAETDGIALTFPSARVHVQQQEHDDARSNFGIMTTTYREENFAPLDETEAWSLHSGEGEILPGIAPRLTPGHTRGHQSIEIRGGDRTAVYVGDVLPTSAHSGAPYNMAYDLLPLENRASKRALLQQAAEEDWLLILGHETQTPAMVVRPDGDWFRLEPEAVV